MGLFNSLFKKKKKSEALDAQPSLQSVDFQDVLGNQYRIRDTGAGIVDESILTGETQSQLSVAQKGLGTLLQEMALTQSQRQAEVSNRQKELYDPLAKDINRQANEESSQLRSREAKRFGGALNSTFSANALASLSDVRIRALESASSGSFSNALKELLDADQSRSLRFDTLSGFLDNAEARKQRYTLAGFDAIQQSKISRQQALQGLVVNNSKTSSKSGFSAQELTTLAKTVASSFA